MWLEFVTRSYDYEILHCPVGLVKIYMVPTAANVNTSALKNNPYGANTTDTNEKNHIKNRAIFFALAGILPVSRNSRT